MIAHRLQTQQPEPSVKFYRTIAISFLVLTVVLLGVVVFITTKKATITILAKDDIKNVNLNVNLVKGTPSTVDTGSVTGWVTSSVFAWTEKYHPTGNKVVEGVASGEVTIYNKTGVSQSLVKTTRLLSPNGILFRLSDRVTIPANGEIVAKVYADQVGQNSEIAPTRFTIPGLSLDKQKFIYAESKATMTGGVYKVGVLTDEDIKAAKVDYLEKVRQAYLAAGNTEFLDHKSIVSLFGDSIVSNKIGEEISEFTLTGNSTVVAVWYNENELKEVVDKEVGSKINLSIDKVVAVAGEPKIAIVSYDIQNQAAQLTVAQNVTVTLDANADKLAVSNFLGKSKDDIERYILGLDHVTGVEVNFSPAWMLSAPSVPDKIKVVVKNI
ncbi:MAG: hypothetical protein WCX97_01820 [Candidatus Magasanikbacteria bacterium]